MRLSQRARFALVGVTGVILIVAMVMTLRNGGGGVPEPRGHLGPTPGPGTAQTYVDAKHAYLDRLARSQPSTEAAALISLQSFAPAPGVQKLMGAMTPTAVWVRFPSSEAEPVLVETTIAGAVADRAVELRTILDAEIDALEEQAAAAQGAAKAELEAAIVASKEDLAKLNADCGCVFAVAVEGAELRDLRALVEAPAVRVVDVPDPPTNDLTGWDLQPFVPRDR